MSTDPDWELFHDDLFDREASPTLRKHGHGLIHGLEALWTQVFADGVVSDGRRSFNHFSLQLDRGEPTAVSIPLSPTHVNDVILRMRGWVNDDRGALSTIALHHAAWLVADPLHGTKRLLECAEHALVPEDLECSW